VKPFNLQIPDPVRLAMDKQAEALGFHTANAWAVVVLTNFSKLDAATAFKLLGKTAELRRSPRPRVSDL